MIPPVWVFYHPTTLSTLMTATVSRSLLDPQLLTTPANVLSSIVVEGYKKMTLVSLIMSGKVPAIPKYAPNAVTRHVKSHASEYEALAKCCQV